MNSFINAPVISSVDGPEEGFGPVLCHERTAGRIITLQSKGLTSIINPAYSPIVPGSEFRITRNYGFGTIQGQVLLEDLPLDIVSWTDVQIQAKVPMEAETGRITLIRGDNAVATEVGVTLHVVDCNMTTARYVPAEYATIQAAIDAANPGDLILVAPGTYNENIIMNKPVRLQGSGAGGTTIFCYPSVAEELQAWHDRLNALGAMDFATFLIRDPFAENEAPGIIVIGETTFTGGTIQNPDTEITMLFNEGYPFDLPGQTLIDSFTISGSKAGGAIFAVSGASNLVITNINATGNQGTYGGGITVGSQGLGFDSGNENIVIRRCKIHKNGGVQGSGGICMNEFSNGYLIEDNLIWGNFSRFNGGGIGHLGLCLGDNIIRGNKIIFNEVHFGALLARAGDGGGIFIGDEVVGGNGTGNVTITGNLIQGNMTGAGYGGGIRAFGINGEDVSESPDDSDTWYALNIFNNIIINNVAGLSGAGISLQDTAKVTIINNTITNNDCTATSALAFTAGQLNSTPQPSGIVGALHSDLLAAMFGVETAQSYSNPVLEDNIIWHNRSWYNDAALNDSQGGLAPRPESPYWDLAILGSTAEEDPHLMPTNCILSSQIDPATGFDYGDNNVYTNPLVVAGYENQLVSATVLDEGGNNINVLFTPLTIAGSDYHITVTSPAIGLGGGTYIAAFDELENDYDGQTRVGLDVDSGADQFVERAVIYEAEDANLIGPVVTSVMGGYTGTGFADYINANNDYIEWTVNADTSGSYRLVFRYALAAGNRPLRILLQAFKGSGHDISSIEWGLQNSAIDLGSVGPDNDYGEGLIDVYADWAILLADINHDAHIDFADLIILATYWLDTCTDPVDDCQNSNFVVDNQIDLLDFAFFAKHWLK